LAVAADRVPFAFLGVDRIAKSRPASAMVAKRSSALTLLPTFGFLVLFTKPGALPPEAVQSLDPA